MSTMKYFILVVAAIVAVAVTTSARASFFDPKLTGNSQFIYGPPPGAINGSSDAVANFTVWNNNGGNWQTQLGLSATYSSQVFSAASSNLATANNSQYVYFYQLVNTNPYDTPDHELSALQITLPSGASVTGAGFVGGTVFYDNTLGSSGVTGPSGNARLGVLPDTTPLDDVPGNGVPSEFGVVNPGFVGGADPTATSAVSPTGVSLSGSVLNFRFLDTTTFLGTLNAGAWSTILFITSNSPPGYLPGSTQNGAADSADIPTPGAPLLGSITPEPANLVMLSGVLVCAGIGLVVSKYRLARSV